MKNAAILISALALSACVTGYDPREIEAVRDYIAANELEEVDQVRTPHAQMSFTYINDYFVTIPTRRGDYLAEFVSECRELRRQQFTEDMVDIRRDANWLRARFDTILADQASRQGAEVRYGQTITGFDRDDGRPVLDVRDEDGSRYRVDASFVLDASGFGRVLARLLDLDRPSTFPSRTSLFTHVRDNIDAPELQTRWDQHIESLTTPAEYDDCVAMLRRVAMKLNDIDWREVFPTSKSFVVVARDTELECSITDDLKGSVPADKLQKLRDRGLAP